MIKRFYVLDELLSSFLKGYSFISKEYIRLVKFSTISDPGQFLKNVSTNAHSAPFSILFDVEPSEANISWLVRLIYLKSFHKDTDSITVFINGQSNHLIKMALIEHGFANVYINNIANLPNLVIGELSGFICSVNPNLGIDVVITQLQPTSLSLVQNYKDQMLAVLKLIFSSQQTSAGRIREIIKENFRTKKLVKELSSELSNHKQYLEIALKQKETEHILNFYHQEYEVLPLWYKRLGHIIKIIMGQRKFMKGKCKSL